MMVGRLLSFWDGLFSGAMLNFQGVIKTRGPIWVRSYWRWRIGFKPQRFFSEISLTTNPDWRKTPTKNETNGVLTPKNLLNFFGSFSFSKGPKKKSGSSPIRFQGFFWENFPQLLLVGYKVFFPGGHPSPRAKGRLGKVEVGNCWLIFCPEIRRTPEIYI